MQATACFPTAFVLLAVCLGPPTASPMPVGGGAGSSEDASSSGLLWPDGGDFDSVLSKWIGQAGVPTSDDFEFLDFESALSALDASMQSTIALGDVKSPGSRPSADSLAEVRPAATAAAPAAEAAPESGWPEPTAAPWPVARTEVGALRVDQSALFEETFQAYFRNTREKYLEWLASLSEEEWSIPKTNSSEDEPEDMEEEDEEEEAADSEEAGEPSLVQPAAPHRQKMTAQEQAMVDVQSFYSALDAIEELKHIRMPSDIVKEFEDSLMEDEDATGGVGNITGNRTTKKEKQASGFLPIPGLGSITKSIPGLGGGGKPAGGKPAGGIPGLGGAGGIAGVSNKVLKFDKNLKDTNKKLKKAKWNVEHHLKGLMTMVQNLKPYLDCLKKCKDKQYHDSDMQKVYDKMIKKSNKGKKPYDFEIVFKALWKTTYLSPRVRAGMKKVLEKETRKDFGAFKNIVEGNLQQFTVKNLETPTWIEPIADEIYAVYLSFIKQPGFCPMKCAADEILKTSYKDLKQILLAIGSHHMRQIKKYWDKLLPQAMKWITTALLNFFTQNAPQVGIMITAMNRRISKQCFDLYNKKNVVLQNYLRLRKDGKALQSEYESVFKVLNETFIPAASLQEGKSSPLDAQKTAIAEASMAADTMIENVLTASTKKWLMEFQPMVQSTIVQPLMGQTVSTIRTVGLSVRYAVQGMFGLLPYVGAAEFDIVGQVLQACENFVAGKLEDLGMLTLASFFKSMHEQVPYLSSLVVKDYHAEHETSVQGQTDMGGGIDAGVKSSDPSGFSATAAAVKAKVYEGLKADQLRKDLAPLDRVVAIVAGLVKEAMPSVKKTLEKCDAMSDSMKDLFAPAKP
mmetsp:Transcript_78652/g.204269  ORF Transcript_78652/g.204269 Transcript_78652/m.204269 type:complete len:853 (+) Transcript_78652:88-2646(+)